MDRIYVAYGSDELALAKEILEGSNTRDFLPKNKDALIGIKPNLVLAAPHTEGATTSPYLVEGLIKYLKDLGYHNLLILEGSWVGDRTARAFKLCGYEELSRKYSVPLMDLQKDTYRTYTIEEVEIDVCDRAMEVDFLINLPVLKGHCQTRITCALKNMKGCIPDTEKRRFHSLGLHRPIALLNRVLKQDLILVDGLIGDLNFEEGGNPVQMNRLLLARDPVLLDSYVAELLGYRLEDIPYIGMAENLGVGKSLKSNSQIVELNEDRSPSTLPKTREIKRLAEYIQEDSACSACYASLIHALDRLDERGQLRYLKEKVHIGQGYRGKKGPGPGIGVCTRHLDRYLPGCPPTALTIGEFLEDSLN